MVQLRQLQKNGIASKPRMRKYRQSSSSPDELDSEDEANFITRERAAIERTAAEDDNYRPPAAKRRA